MSEEKLTYVNISFKLINLLLVNNKIILFRCY